MISEIYLPWFITDSGRRRSYTILFQYICYLRHSEDNWVQKKIRKNSFRLLMCQYLRLRPIVLVHTQVYHKKHSVKQLKKERKEGEKNDLFRSFRFAEEGSEAEPHHIDLLDSATICRSILVQTSSVLYCYKSRNQWKSLSDDQYWQM